GQVKRRHVANIAAALRPRVGGGAVIGIERGFLLEDAHSVASEKIQVWDDESIRMNDGGCDPDGRFYCGSMGYDQQHGVASPYQPEHDLAFHPVVGDVTSAND